MINIKIICVGKVKEKSLQDLINEYQKRLTKFCKLDIIELDDEKLPKEFNNNDALKIKEKESSKVLEKIEKIGKCDVFLLDIYGKEYTSIEFSKKIFNIATYNTSTLVFVIGGSLGMSEELLKKYEKISFSKMTFPHQLFRLFLLEQIFRAFKIESGQTYHH